ncbi:MAG: hypothetical protein GY830_05900 [Bacteroidetes bacterium]|nr:hypothetical protein [Bacteroidota bacterium]
MTLNKNAENLKKFLLILFYICLTNCSLDKHYKVKSILIKKEKIIEKIEQSYKHSFYSNKYKALDLVISINDEKNENLNLNTFLNEFKEIACNLEDWDFYNRLQYWKDDILRKDRLKEEVLALKYFYEYLQDILFKDFEEDKKLNNNDISRGKTIKELKSDIAKKKEGNYQAINKIIEKLNYSNTFDEQLTTLFQITYDEIYNYLTQRALCELEFLFFEDKGLEIYQILSKNKFSKKKKGDFAPIYLKIEELNYNINLKLLFEAYSLCYKYKNFKPISWDKLRSMEVYFPKGCFKRIHNNLINKGLDISFFRFETIKYLISKYVYNKICSDNKFNLLSIYQKKDRINCYTNEVTNYIIKTKIIKEKYPLKLPYGYLSEYSYDLKAFDLLLYWIFNNPHWDFQEQFQINFSISFINGCLQLFEEKNKKSITSCNELCNWVNKNSNLINDRKSPILISKQLINAIKYLRVGWNSVNSLYSIPTFNYLCGHIQKYISKNDILNNLKNYNSDFINCDMFIPKENLIDSIFKFEVPKYKTKIYHPNIYNRRSANNRKTISLNHENIPIAEKEIIENVSNNVSNKENKSINNLSLKEEVSVNEEKQDKKEFDFRNFLDSSRERKNKKRKKNINHERKSKKQIIENIKKDNLDKSRNFEKLENNIKNKIKSFFTDTKNIKNSKIKIKSNGIKDLMNSLRDSKTFNNLIQNNELKANFKGLNKAINFSIDLLEKLFDHAERHSQNHPFNKKKQLTFKSAKNIIKLLNQLGLNPIYK